MHYTDDELLDRLYGVGRQDQHLETCSPCRGRWEDLLLRRRAWLEPRPELEAWARMRLSQPAVAPARLQPLAALAALVLLALALMPPSAPPAQVMAAGDAQLLREIYTMMQDDEPRAAAAVHALFETQP